MPHSELDRMAKGRRQCGSPQPQVTSGLASVASMTGSDIVELAWENGRIAMRGTSSNTHIARDWEGFNTKKKKARYDRNELLSEPYAPNLNALSEYITINTNNCHDKQHHIGILNPKQGVAFKSVGEEHQLTKLPTSNELCQSSFLQPCQASVPFVKSNSSIPITNIDSMGGSPAVKMQKLHDPGTNNMKTGLMNFSHFLKPVALVEASLQCHRPTNISGLSRVEEFKKINNKISGANTSNTAESMRVEPVATVPELILSKARPPKDPLIIPDEYSEDFFQQDVSRRKESPGQVPGQASSLLGAAQEKPADTERFIEPIVPSSSVCSHGASNDPTCYLKRKNQGGEESAYLSENTEEDDDDFVKTVPVRGNTGAKRRRTAQMHNLFERRRRDKINKKMRVLRQLIPNCNKLDKASILDEAIEYMKTLQLQAQIMSMGCIPQMMLPSGIQQIYAPHFSPVGAGMGMRMDMDQLQFPSSQSGATSLPGITGTGFQMLGFPGQGLPVSLSHAHFIPSAQSVPLGNVSGSSSMVEHPTLVPTSSSMNSIQNINFEINC